MPDRTDMRRRDRGETDIWIKEFLGRAPIGVIATADDGQPFINSNLFVYSEADHAIYFHTANRGRTLDNVEANPRVCFSVFEMGRLLPADEALEFSVEYGGVTAFGTCTIVEDGEKAGNALQLLLDRYAPHLEAGKDYRGITDDELERTAVFRIDIEEWTGKKKEVEAGFPGAFNYGGL